MSECSYSITLTTEYTMSRTLQELAQEALRVQDACNLCGVAQAFAQAMIDLRKHYPNTEEANRHAITRLWVSKLASLSHSFGALDDIAAINAVYALTGDKAGAP